MINLQPSAVQHEGLCVVVSLQGAVHVWTDFGGQRRVEATHGIKGFNLRQLVGSSTGDLGQHTPSSATANATTRQIIKNGLQDWYQLRWVKPSDGSPCVPLCGNASHLIATDPRLRGWDAKHVQAWLNGKSFPNSQRTPWCADLKLSAGHWTRLPSPPLDAIYNPTAYGLRWASEADRINALQEITLYLNNHK